MIIEGRIINHDSEQYGQIFINPVTGLIDNVGENLGPADLKVGGLIFPGFVDIHVHCREDISGKEMYKEDYQTASRAAIHGGVVHVADMPNNPVPPIDEGLYQQKQKLADRALIDVTLYSYIGRSTSPLPFPVPYKAFLSQPPVGELFFTDKTELEAAMSRYRGQFVSFHCEDPEILAANKDKPTHAERRPRESEISGIRLAITLIKKFNLRGKICHMSTKDGLELVKQAKKEGLNITAEVTPHHLYFDPHTKRQSRYGVGVNPPIRTEEDRLALIAGLKSGDIDFLATDHAPHTIEEQKRGVSGLPHLDTYGPFVTWLMKEHEFMPQEIARVCSFNPGNFVNEFNEHKFGRIEKGYVGSLTIINPDAPITIKKEDLQTKVKWSPFEGVAFPGRVTHAIVSGKVYENN